VRLLPRDEADKPSALTALSRRKCWLEDLMLLAMDAGPSLITSYSATEAGLRGFPAAFGP